MRSYAFGLLTLPGIKDLDAEPHLVLISIHHMDKVLVVSRKEKCARSRVTREIRDALGESIFKGSILERIEAFHARLVGSRIFPCSD